MKRNFEITIFLFILISFVITNTVSSETGNSYWPENEPTGERYWDIVRWDELLQVDDNGNVNVAVRILLEFYNITSDIWYISIDLGPNITTPVLHENNHSKFINNKNFTSEDHRTILEVNFSSSISKVYKVYSLGFSYHAKTPLIVEKVSDFWEMTNRFRLSNQVSFFPNFVPRSINYYIGLPSKASLHRHNVNVDENVVIPQTLFNLVYWDPDFLHPDTDDSFLEIPDIEEYHISKISREETFPDNKIFIEYTTPNDIIGIFIIVAAVFSILSILGSIAAIFKRSNKFISDRKKKKMKNSWERNRNLCLLIGLAIIAIGFIFMMAGIGSNNVNFIEAAKWLLAIGLSLISIGIACHAVMISNKSDEKMIALTNLNFTEKHAMMQTYIQDFKRQNYDRAEQCKLDFEAAIEIKEWASVEKKEEYIDDLITLIDARLEKPVQKENIRTVEEILIDMIDKAVASKMATKIQMKKLIELKEKLLKYKKKIP